MLYLIPTMLNAKFGGFDPRVIEKRLKVTIEDIMYCQQKCARIQDVFMLT